MISTSFNGRRVNKTVHLTSPVVDSRFQDTTLPIRNVESTDGSCTTTTIGGILSGIGSRDGVMTNRVGNVCSPAGCTLAVR